jgi:biotin operon repressor
MGMMKAKAATLAIMIVLLLLALPAAPVQYAGQAKALAGLEGVYVSVAPLNPEAERLGLTRAQIQTDVELRLRKTGIRILTSEETKETPGNPNLLIDITTSISGDLCAYTITVQLGELVSLAKGNKVYATIWVATGVGTFWTQDVRKIRGYVGDCVDQFINDYLAANPK